MHEIGEVFNSSPLITAGLSAGALLLTGKLNSSEWFNRAGIKKKSEKNKTGGFQMEIRRERNS